jgi:uncharacterized membrane protein (DUF4010 family)
VVNAVPLSLSAEKLALLLALSFFFGLSFEDFYAKRAERPGGIRTFPLLALAGAGLYLLQPTNALPFAAGLLVLGAWLYAYYRAAATGEDPTAEGSRSLMVPICSLLAYILGPVTLSEPAWVAVSYTVAGVLLLWGRQQLHDLARSVPAEEIFTLGKFLVLTGIVLPLLPDQPVLAFARITPYQVWLAVVAVSAVSYASYLLQRYLAPKRGSLVAAALGGLYSSTVTTAVLARHARQQPARKAEFCAGIVLATSVMYLRVDAVIAAFDWRLAYALAPSLLGLCALGLVIAALLYWFGAKSTNDAYTPQAWRNPLELTAAAIFAAIFVVVSLTSAFVQGRFGSAGEYWLAAVVGVSDIDPFVLSVAQSTTDNPSRAVGVVAILIAASSNNLLKAGYALGFAGFKNALPAAAALGLLTAGGAVLALSAAG